MAKIDEARLPADTCVECGDPTPGCNDDLCGGCRNRHGFCDFCGCFGCQCGEHDYDVPSEGFYC